jgi:hypothetical protein
MWLVGAALAMAALIITHDARLPHINTAFKLSDGISGGVIGAVASLFGAGVGSYTAYKYNVKLEKERIKERRAIQTKNTIISPIYKQLLGLKEYLDTQQATAKHPKIIVYFAEYSRYNTYTFNIWESIKQDIRKRYVPQANRDELERLTQLIKEHMDLQDPDDPVEWAVSYRFYVDHKNQITNPKHWNHQMLTSTFAHNVQGSDSVEGSKKAVERQLRLGFNFSEEEYAEYTE